MFVSDTVVTALILNTTFIRLGLGLKAQRSSAVSVAKLRNPTRHKTWRQRSSAPALIHPRPQPQLAATLSIRPVPHIDTLLTLH